MPRTPAKVTQAEVAADRRLPDWPAALRLDQAASYCGLSPDRRFADGPSRFANLFLFRPPQPPLDQLPDGRGAGHGAGGGVGVYGVSHCLRHAHGLHDLGGSGGGPTPTAFLRRSDDFFRFFHDAS